MTGTVRRRRVALPVPVDGVALPLGDKGDVKAWARSVAQSRMAGQGGPGEVEAYADMLVAATADSEERGATLAIVFAPYPSAGEVGRIEVLDYVPSAGMPELPELSEIVDWLSSPAGGAADRPEIVYGELPLGPAARLKFQVLSDPDADDAATLLKNTVYVLRPREHDCIVVMNVTWASGAFTVELDKLADQLARQIQIG